MPINRRLSHDSKALFVGLWIALSGIAANAAEPVTDTTTTPLEINNSWSVQISNELRLKSPLLVTLRQSGNHWEVVDIFDTPQQILRTEKLEVFLVSRDFQKWKNFYPNAVTNCDSFEAKEYSFHSVCSSSLSEKRSASAAIVGMLFGGKGKQPVLYNEEKVAAVIHSIRIEQATEMLTAYEQGRLPIRITSGG